MTSPQTNAKVREWSATRPEFTGFLTDDSEELARFAAGAEDLLSELPAKPERDIAGQHTADEIFTAARAARREFLELHSERVYEQLTSGLTRYLRLGELLYAAADRFPGLVPTRTQMEAELSVVQAAKEGREIDQAILCGAVLRSRRTGMHLIDAMLMPTPRSVGLIDRFREAGRLDLDSIRIERHGSAAYVTFCNPDHLNAEDNTLIADLEVAVDLVLMDDRVRVGVLRGGPVSHPRYGGRRVFSAGINLKDLRNGAISFVDFLLGRELGYVHKLLRGLLTDVTRASWHERVVTKPWVGAVDAFAIGGGMQLLLVLDRVIVESEAFMSLPAAEEGIVPGLANLRLTRAAGARLARQIILGGRRIHAGDAEAGLFCDEVVPASSIEASLDRAVKELEAPAVAANRHMLALAEEPPDQFRAYLAEFALTQVVRTYSEDVLDKVERRWQRSESRA
ncbi:(3,5-dihydroxyphenyl)acetyl-CoA 1,2-dioxygenase DpgC [Streptosporangium sandarakinum]|uniref:(3,5-dihydroxyphenyl)acetyl-CoA 1,2-dioxygenase DpgC n=1 Tax=Streptosporangium sandarakinum TaxID=1260955 RepID=UPI0034154F08